MTRPDRVIESLSERRDLYDLERHRERIEAIDQIEEIQAGMRLRTGSRDSFRISSTAALLKERLETRNQALYRLIREEVRQRSEHRMLLGQLRTAVEKDFGASEQRGTYDHLDVLLAGVLQFDLSESDVADAEPEMVAYQPTPARQIFRLIEIASLSERDVFVDLGSGIGHVALLTAILTPASCIGVEREPAYVACARRAAGRLSISNVSFVVQDARDADFSIGSVFYLYTPFWGGVLRSVLDSMRAQAETRAVRIASYGPVTIDIGRENWLEAQGEATPEAPVLFRAR